MTEEPRVGLGADRLAAVRTLLAAERTFSAWIRTGLAAVGGGLAIARVLVVKNPAREVVAQAIGGLLVLWGAGVFLYAILRYNQACQRLTDGRLSGSTLGAMKVLTTTLLVIAALVFWITLP